MIMANSLDYMSLEESKDLELKYIDLFYPSQKDLSRTDVFHNPSMHFYFCLGNCQVFLRKVRSKFVVSCRGFAPHGVSYEDISFVTFCNVGTFSDVDSAIVRYRSLCLEVLDGFKAYNDDKIPF